MQNSSQQLEEKIIFDMRRALRGREVVRVETLKALLARFSNEEVVKIESPKVSNETVVVGAGSGVGSTEAPRRILSLADKRRIISEEMSEIEQALSRLKQPSEHRSELKQKLSILQEYID